MVTKNVLQRLAMIVMLTLSVWTISMNIDNSNRLAFAYTPSPALTVHSDKVMYAANEPVVVSGRVSTDLRDLGSEKVSVEVFDPYGEKYLSTHANLTEDDSYSYRFQFKDNDSKGEYQILLTSYYAQAAKIINFGEDMLKPDDFHTYVIRVDDKNDTATSTTYHLVRYKQSEGVKLNVMAADIGAHTVNIAVTESQRNGKGQLTIELPRSLIDSRQEKNASSSADKDYVVAIGRAGGGIGYTDAFREIQSTPDSRTLVIDLLGSFSDGGDADTVITIRGTQVAPEFGSISLIIGAVGIVSALVMISHFKSRAGIGKIDA